MAALSAYIEDSRFNEIFELSAGREQGKPFRIKYADYGYRNNAASERENVVLFFGALLASRLVHIAKDELAKKHKLRIIIPDRPQIGGTGAVDKINGMKHWREAVLALLQHLGVRHVSICCHSGGTVYALDMILHHPEILHPDRPYLAVGGPWILPKHTGSTILSLVQSLPTPVIGSTDTLAKLINNYIGPLLGMSFGLSYNVVKKFMPSPPPNRDFEVNERDGVTLEAQLWPYVIERIYAEGVRGISSDAILFLQKGMPGWSDWGDYDTGIPRLAEILRNAGEGLTVDVFYAENDALVGGRGAKGPRWFDHCWEGCGDAFNYRSTAVPGADHDGIWNLRWGAVQVVFEKIAQLAEEELTASHVAMPRDENVTV